MKDKLRELAERWRIYGSHMTGHECSDELLATLDAEGDGGAVAQYQYRFQRAPAASWSGWINCDKSLVPLLDGKPGHEVRSLYTHPARSGVVSDEDVRDAARYRWLRDDPPLELSVRRFPGETQRGCYLDGYVLDQAIDAAIQGERHER